MNLDLAPTLPLIVADASQLRQVVMNLVIIAQQELAERLPGQGAAGYLQKAFSRQDMNRALQRALDTETPSD